ncbi:MAG: alpha/beta hydrolase-fold protein, partial [Candidatus Heimdallarchaeota archaeon]|nr:alpha/beta hydrolase-fold protein [Candidatus Heimdallarchaeota archaeon]
MKFSIFLPSISKIKNVPFLVYLSGLTCTYENFTTKANAFGWAEKEGIAIIIPDTSPRGKHVPDKSDEYDFGKGAGFYINATEDPWHKNYQMETYITKELHSLVINNFPLEM